MNAPDGQAEEWIRVESESELSAGMAIKLVRRNGLVMVFNLNRREVQKSGPCAGHPEDGCRAWFTTTTGPGPFMDNRMCALIAIRERRLFRLAPDAPAASDETTIATPARTRETVRVGR